MNGHRNITYRLLPQKKASWRWLERTLHAQQQLYNAALEERIDRYRKTSESVSYMDQCRSLTECRRDLPEMAAIPVSIQRGTLLRLQRAYDQFFRGCGFPKFKSRRRFNSFTITEGARVTDGWFHIPKFGRLRLRGSNPYPDGEVRTVTVKLELGRWYATVCHSADLPDAADDGKAIGVDMNVGQVTDSEGEIHRMPDTTKWDRRVLKRQRRVARKKKGSNRRRKAVKSLRKAIRRRASICHNWRHHVSKRVAAKAGTVVVEDLKVRNMTRSAKDTAENPGRNVAAKSGLNRAILKTGWGEIRRMLEYKAAHVVAVNPAHTSQECGACGNVDAASRRSQSVYECVACGHAENADVNAAENILGLGIGSKAGVGSAGNGRGGDGVVLGQPDQSGLGSVHDICQKAA